MVVDVIPQAVALVLALSFPGLTCRTLILRQPARLIALVLRVQQECAEPAGGVVIGQCTQEEVVELKGCWILC